MLDELMSRYRAGDRLALARLLTLVARGERLREISLALGWEPSAARTIVVTGAGGVGKSTLVGALIQTSRGRGQRVAVLACDPRSPVSGGAVLGDRFRMPTGPDDGVYIRSLTAGDGVVARDLWLMNRLLRGFGFDLVLVETAGAGQGDTVFGVAVDLVLLVLQPQAGDDVQWDKAGVLEVADVVVINKADLPGAGQTEVQVVASLALSPGRAVPVLRACARTGTGIPELLDKLTTLKPRLPAAVTPRDFLRAGFDELERWLNRLDPADGPGVADIIVQWGAGTLKTAAALRAFLALAEARDVGQGPPAGVPKS